MELMLWAFGSFFAVALTIIGVAGWVAFRRDRDAPNAGLRKRKRSGAAARSSPIRGVPKSR